MIMDNIWKDEHGYLEKIKDKERFGIFLDMGTGKTSLLLALIDYHFFTKYDVKKVLIIAPKIVSLSTWQDEIKKWKNFNYMENIIKLLAGTIKKEDKMLADTGEYAIHIVSSSNLGWLYGRKIKKGKKSVWELNKNFPNYDMIIVDECSEFKDYSSNRFETLKLMCKDKKLFLLSGTPFPNMMHDEKYKNYSHPEEMYYVMYLLGIFTDGITAFKSQLCFSLPWSEHQTFITDKNYNIARDFIYKKSIHNKMEYGFEVIEEKIYCPLDKERMKVLKKDYVFLTDDLKKITSDNKAIMINKTLQLSNGFIYDENKKAIRINTYKFQELIKLLKKIEGNVIIFYIFREDYDYILEHIDGINTCENAEDIEKFMKGESKIALLSPQSHRFGLNLQENCNNIIWFGLIWSGESFTQSNRRIIRPGQKKDVNIYYILAKDSFDEYVYNVVSSKVEVIDNFKKLFQ